MGVFLVGGGIILTLKDINLAITNQVKNGLIGTAYSDTNFPTTDMGEKIERTAFYIEFLNNKIGNFNSSCKERTLKVKLYFYSTDKYQYKLELLLMESYLENIFYDYLKISDSFIINTGDTTFDTLKGGILICNLDLYTIENVTDETFDNTPQSTENDNQEIIEELDITIR